MPSFQDSAVIFFLALLLFGPKKLPELARQLGKLMAEFRRASNEFRMQMEDELRAADQAEQQKKIAEMQAAAPVPQLAGEAPPLSESPENTIAESAPIESTQLESAPLPIATSGDLCLMPPSTGLPVSNSTLSPMLDSIPHTPAPEPAHPEPGAATEATLHG